MLFGKHSYRESLRLPRALTRTVRQGWKRYRLKAQLAIEMYLVASFAATIGKLLDRQFRTQIGFLRLRDKRGQ